MEIHLKTKELDLRLPVVPPSIEVSDSQGNETAVIHNAGEVNLLGKTGLRTISIQSIWPKKQYYFSDSTPFSPYQAMKLLKRWKDTGTTPILYITNTDISWAVSIENMTYIEDDATGDLSYTLDLKEYKTINRRIEKRTTTIKYKVKKGDTLEKIAYKYLGASKYAKLIYKQNKNAIEKRLKAYVRAYNKKIRRYNKKHKRKKKLLKWKNSKKGKRLIKGTRLVIRGVIK